MSHDHGTQNGQPKANAGQQVQQIAERCAGALEFEAQRRLAQAMKFDAKARALRGDAEALTRDAETARRIGGQIARDVTKALGCGCKEIAAPEGIEIRPLPVAVTPEPHKTDAVETAEVAAARGL